MEGVADFVDEEFRELLYLQDGLERVQSSWDLRHKDFIITSSSVQCSVRSA